MKRKKFLAMGMVLSMSLASALTGCGGSSNTTATTDETSKATDTTEKSDSTDTAATEETSTGEVSKDEELTIEVYDVASNYQGLQTGWYAKILKDKFNIVLNIIAPQVSGDASSLYQTRCASGNLGDLILLDNIEMQKCISNGLIGDFGAEYANMKNLQRYDEQIKLFNSSMSDVAEGSIYAIPTEMNTNGPTAYVGDTVYSTPRLPWDYYCELGCPEMKNLDDLLKVLKDMVELHPTNANGDQAFAISLWPDWDGTSIETVNQITKWYGQEVNGSVLLGVDNSMTSLIDRSGAYYKMLKFFNDAQLMGLVDPDSPTQDWNNVCDNKMKQKRVYLEWYNWQRGFWNTPERGEQGDIYLPIPIADQQIYQASDSYYGSGRAWGIGSGVEGDKKARILEFLDWYASPEGVQLQHAGTEGLIYTVGDDGKYVLTPEGFNRHSAELQVPEELGGGLWADGNNQLNQWIVGSCDTNPNTGETYGTDMWASSIEANKTKGVKEWIEKYGAENEVEYFKAHGMLTPVANINKPLADDTTDIALIRNQCAQIVKDSSWKMIFASSSEEFEQLWDDMCSQVEGFGWNDLFEFDKQKYQVVVDARNAAK